MAMTIPGPRHLLYHLYPRRNGLWRFNVNLLKPHLRLFNGKKVVHIATDNSTEPPQLVRDAFEDPTIQFEVTPNHPLHETGPFIDILMPQICSEKGVTFYAHGKGASYGKRDVPYVLNWARNMYYHNLHAATFDLLESYEAVGVYRRKMLHGPSPWHYSGTFFWFRNDSVFQGEKDWRCIERGPHGVEQYIGCIVPYEHSACVYGDNAPNLYIALY
jgi:hypothetical protein